MNIHVLSTPAAPDPTAGSTPYGRAADRLLPASGVGLTAFLVNRSRALLPDIAHDTLATSWIPAEERPGVSQLWQEYARAVYRHDDLVVSLRGRFILDTLRKGLERHPDSVLVVVGAGFTSYPWLLEFPAALEIDLPGIITAKQQRVRELESDGVLDRRAVEFLAADLSQQAGRQQVVDRAVELADGRPIAFVAEGLIFYLPEEAAVETAGLGARMTSGPTLQIASYWPSSRRLHAVLEAQRRWFRDRGVPHDSTYLTRDQVSARMVGQVDEHTPDELQRRYLGRVVVPETELVPEHVVVARA